MRVLVQPADRQACGYYRLIWPTWYLEDDHDVKIDEVGYKVHFRNFEREWIATGSDPPADAHVSMLEELPDADVVVWQRPAKRWLRELMPFLQSAGIKIVIDVDDAFHCMPRMNQAFSALTAGPAHPHMGWQWIDECCKQADLVTASTPELAKRWGHGHGVCLPNLVPPAYLKINPEKKHHYLGWPGNVSTHPGDLESTNKAVPTAMRGTDWTFLVIGSGNGVPERLGLPKVRATGWASMDAYPRRLGELEAGIVPVCRNRFNLEGKSWLKAAEMASLGVAFVATDQGDYARWCRRLNIGELASSRSQWQRQLRRLLTDDAYRADRAAHGREVMKEYTYERHAHLWWEAWSKVLTSPTSRRTIYV